MLIQTVGAIADQSISDLDQISDDFPEDFFKMKVMPELMKSAEFGGGGPKAVGVVMKIAAKLSSDDFDARITPFVIRLFGNPDRAIRVCLLDSLPSIIDHLSQKTVNDKIFPHLVCVKDVQHTTTTNILQDYWIHRPRPGCARANFEVCSCHHRKIV